MKIHLNKGVSVTQLVPVPVEDSICPAVPTPLPAVYVPVFIKLANVPEVVAWKVPVTLAPVASVSNILTLLKYKSTLPPFVNVAKVLPPVDA